MPRLIFFGTPEFSAIILDMIAKKGTPIAAVVTRPDKPAGRHLAMRPPAIKAVALHYGLPLLQPEKTQTPEFLEQLKTFDFDLIVVASFAAIFKEPLLQLPRLGCINVHPSLLPRYRGSAPIERAIMAGEKMTGVTIIEMKPLVDAGDILAARNFPIDHEITGGELTRQLAHVGAELLVEVLKAFDEGVVQKSAQDNRSATLAPKLSVVDEKIDWNKSAWQLHNQIRALSPKPGAWAQIEVRGKPKRLNIKKACVETHLQTDLPAATLLQDRGLVVATGNGCLRLLEVQLEGKRHLNAAEFTRGILKEELRFVK